MKEEKELIKTLHDMASIIEEIILSLQTAFVYNNLSPLSYVHEKCDTLKKQIPKLTEQIVSLSRDNPHIRQYVSIPTHIAMMTDSTEKLSDLISKRIKEDILFSDRAISEITFLLQRLIDIIKPASDIILAPNSILGNYIRESEAGIVRRANDYATQHEERLIEGLCLPAASALYINILDGIKNIAWHCKEIANKLTP